MRNTALVSFGFLALCQFSGALWPLPPPQGHEPLGHHPHFGPPSHHESPHFQHDQFDIEGPLGPNSENPYPYYPFRHHFRENMGGPNQFAPINAPDKPEISITNNLIQPPWFTQNIDNIPSDPLQSEETQVSPQMEYLGTIARQEASNTFINPGFVSRNQQFGATNIQSAKLEKIKECIENCPITAEYNPVCGSDYVTYSNLGHYRCAHNCGADISILKMEQCSTDSQPRLSVQPKVLECVRNCEVKEEFLPACGTNLVTYANIERLNCARRCGVDVRLDRMTSCQAEVAVSNPITKVEVDICLQLCPIKSILEPVCGTDNQTYINRGHLECAQKCGFSVRYSKKDYCNRPITQTQCPEPIVPSSSESTPALTPAELNACIQQCPLTREDNPVCGTDGVTYTNPGWLLCSQFCGVDVKVKKLAACNSNSQSNKFECSATPVAAFESCMSSCPSPGHVAQVCGSDGVTYRNVDELRCAKGCGVNVTLKSRQACPISELTPLPLTPSTTTASKPTPGYYGVNPTILDEIFQLPSSSPGPSSGNDPDEDLDIDERFQENSPQKH